MVIFKCIMGINGCLTLNREIFGLAQLIEHINLVIEFLDGKNMRTKMLTLFFTLGFVLYSTFSCQSSQSNSTNKQIMSMLKDFYISYNEYPFVYLISLIE